MWSGEFYLWGSPPSDQKIIDELMKTPFPESKKSYLTRLETRMDPAAMTEDIHFLLDPRAKEFQVYIRVSASSGATMDLAGTILVLAVTATGLVQRKKKNRDSGGMVSRKGK
ncbi:unnamed protein product [marine sediment metagenome]|uniref:Uncharacterized protein n=1 Tax=marine sediment metagenome TaxID=412755 RepID=X1H0T8_9ZZZZ